MLLSNDASYFSDWIGPFVVYLFATVAGYSDLSQLLSSVEEASARSSSCSVNVGHLSLTPNEYLQGSMVVPYLCLLGWMCR